jgi:hypothetical protein
MSLQFLDKLIKANWTVWFLIIVLLFFILWLFFGGGEYEYVGLSPLDINVDSTKYANANTYSLIDISNNKAERISGPAQITLINQNNNNNNNNNENSNNNNNNNNNNSDNNSDRIIFTPSRDLKNVTSNIINFTPIDKPPENKVTVIAKCKKYSKGEQKCREVLEEMYKKPFGCVRPDFLKNPETGKNLELDCYNDELKIGLEYNGIQHYRWPNYTNQTKEQFVQQLRRDKYKDEVCAANGIYLIKVPYNVPLNKIKEYIAYYAPENYENRMKNEADPYRIYENMSEDASYCDSFYESDSEETDSDENLYDDETQYDDSIDVSYINN